ncbi:hypothetical protein [Streptomyces sp. NPDC047928]|uniref:hypothetical protein n=1 Tax=unclassified Streptomyces TaxID=2593676 RepID=UPI0037164CD6
MRLFHSRTARRGRTGLAAGLTALALAGGIASAAPAQAASHKLDCLITGGFSYTVCSGKLTVHPGQRVDVDLVSSGGKKVRFCVEPYGGGYDHGCTGWLHPGASTARVWHNDTGIAKDVQLIAGKDVSVRVRAQGGFHVR